MLNIAVFRRPPVIEMVVVAVLAAEVLEADHAEQWNLEQEATLSGLAK
jgi:hypothetical protein